jgi:ABC-2 type transport system permease protein
MKRTWIILAREYLENVRTKAFLIGLVLTPVWMGVIFLVPMLVSAPSTVKVVIVDETGELAGPLSLALAAAQGKPPAPDPERPRMRRAAGHGPTYDVRVATAHGAWDRGPDGTTRIERLKRQAGREGSYLVVITPAVLEKRAARPGEHESGVFGPGVRGMGSPGAEIEHRVTELVTKRLLAQRHLPADLADLIQERAIRFQAIDERGAEASVFQQLLPILVVVLLYMGIVGISQMLISNTIEEKASRVYEVLLSSVSPFQLMAGKILGICGVGLTLLTLWCGGGLLASSLQGAGGLVSGAQIGWFVVYYLLGFLMIASLFVAVGSACNTIKEAQNLMAPLSMLLALPLILSMVTMSNPNGSVATAASFVPPFTPFVMMTRLASVPAPPAWQMWTTLAILLLATYLSVRLAARVFRVGVLLYGQPPSLRQLLRWMRARD